MSTPTSTQQKQYDIALMSQLFDANERITAARDSGLPREEYAKDIAEQTRLIRQLEHRIGSNIKTAVYGYPDRDAAYNEALHQISRTGSVRYYLDKFSKDENGSLEAFAQKRAARKQVRDAGLVGKRNRRDAMYGTTVSIEAAREAYGFDIAAKRDAMSESERWWNTQVIREAFTELASEMNPATGQPYLDNKLIKTVLTIGNLHRDDALPEMNAYAAAAKTLRITERTLYNRVNAAKAAVANLPVLAFAILELCGDNGRFEPVASTAVMAVAA